MAWETRDVTQEDLSYLLRLYLLGPQDEDLEALYPADIRLESASVAGGTVTVTLSPVGNRLTDISFTLAGACLARTCFELLQRLHRHHPKRRPPPGPGPGQPDFPGHGSQSGNNRSLTLP